LILFNLNVQVNAYFFNNLVKGFLTETTIYVYLPDSMGSVGLFSIRFRFFCPRSILNENGRVVLVSKMQYEFTRILYQAITRMRKTLFYKRWHQRYTNAR